MGRCKYCGQDAGFLRGKHKECENRHQAALKRLPGLAMKLMEQGASSADALRELRREIDDNYVGMDPAPFLAQGWGLLLDKFMEDDIVLTDAEDKALLEAKDRHGLTPEAIGRPWLKRVQSIILGQIINGAPPTGASGVDWSGHPFVLSKGEYVVWGWSNVKAYEERTQRTYEGRTQGVSIRIMRGVSYRIGGFKGHPIDTEYQHPLGVGVMVATNKALMWSGGKSLKAPWKKIIAVQAFSDGLGVHLDGRVKPLLFVAGEGEGWFLKALAENMPTLA